MAEGGIRKEKTVPHFDAKLALAPIWRASASTSRIPIELLICCSARPLGSPTPLSRTWSISPPPLRLSAICTSPPPSGKACLTAFESTSLRMSTTGVAASKAIGTGEGVRRNRNFGPWLPWMRAKSSQRRSR
jgi:hypothetical protein